MEEKTKKLCGYIFFGVVILGLVLAIVGMFVGQITVTAEAVGISASESTALFDDVWSSPGAPSNMFAIISFIVLVVGLAVALVDAILRLFVKKNIKVLTIVAAALVLVGAVLVLVSGLLLAGEFKGGKIGSVTYSYSIGTGVILAFIGGILGGVCALLPAVGPFKD